MLKKWVLFLFCVMMFLCPVSANSGPVHWEGTDSNGVIIIDEECPLEVSHEKLTFSIHQFPAFSYETVEEYFNYDAKVTAEYTFFNPEDYALTVRCLFPIGTVMHYGSYYDDETETLYEAGHPSQYQIAVNGEPVDVQIRHSMQSYDDFFDWKTSKNDLYDEFFQDNFYTPELLVTKQTYQVKDVKFGFFDAAFAAFELPVNLESTKITTDFFNAYSYDDHIIKAGFFLENALEFDLYLLGEPIDELSWTVYKNAGMDSVIDGSIALKSTETMTFEDFVFTNYDPETQILKHDWYNLILSQLKTMNELPVLINDDLCRTPYHSPIRWYDYEITIAPHSTLTNTVIAPMFPDISTRYEPPIYTYTYLLSPARNWKSFTNLDIEIHTDFYLSDPSLSGFEKTETGYVLSLDELPDEELVFTLCEKQHPYLDVNTTDIFHYLFYYFYIFGLPVLLMYGFIQFFRKSKI